MKVNLINSLNFQGLYRIDKKYIGPNTNNFFQNNSVIISQNEDNERDLFVLVKDRKDAAFEECIKNDSGKYWKSLPLAVLMRYPEILKTIYHGSAVHNNYRENWVDYTDNWVPSAQNVVD